MSDTYVQVQPNSTGSLIATRQITVNSQNVQLQCFVLGDPTTADHYAAVTAKGTQGAYGLAVQRLHDSGRNPVTLFATPVTGVTAEGLITATQVLGGVAQASATNYTVTSGKTFRITSFTIFGTQTTTTLEWQRVNLRYTTSGTVATTSGIILTAQTSGLAAVNGVSLMPVSISVSDGFEIPGGANYGVSQIANAISTTIGFTITGFEY